jgi:cell division protein FtsZ
MIEEVSPPTDDSKDAKGDSVKFTFDEDLRPSARIKVVGVGGGGCNAVNRMIEEGVEGVQFAAINTDEQALRVSRAQIKLQLGAKLTDGSGAGSDPEVGRNAALEDTERLIELLGDADMVFVTTGLGGGTGTGAAPIVASLAKEMGALTVAIATKPFSFEGARRMEVAQQGLSELVETVDTVVTIPNERLLEYVDRGTSFFESFRIADDILLQAVQGISDIITIPGIINRDFADVRTIMQGMGYAVMGTATRGGSSAAVEAARAAVSSPLLEDASIDGARGILINITGSSRLGLHEVHEASTIIQKAADPNANIIFGAVLNDSMGDDVKITVIATGFRNQRPGNKEFSADNSVVIGQDIRSAARQAAGGFRTGAAAARPAPTAMPEPADPTPPIESVTPEPEAASAGLPASTRAAEEAEQFAVNSEPTPAEMPVAEPVGAENLSRPAFFRRRSSE